MHSELKTVALGDIDLNDRSFVVTEGRDTAALTASIASCGLLQPPCLWRPLPQDAYTVVCGYLRLAALRDLGHRELRAWVFDPGTPHTRLLECALLDNLAQRRFNQVETAHALQRLLECFPRSVVIARWLPRFGLAASGRQLDRLVRLCSLESDIRAALLSGSLTGASALRLCGWATADRLAAFSLMRQLHLSSGKQAELLECIEDLARRDAASPGHIAGSADIAAICADAGLNRVQKTETVRRMLRERRFPRLHRAEQRFASAVQELHLPAGIRLAPPPNFEGRVFRAEIAFSSADELRAHARALLAAGGKEACERLCGNEPAGDAARPDCTGGTRHEG